MALEWPLLTGGCYSEVVVRTGLTVLKFNLIFFTSLLGQLLGHCYFNLIFVLAFLLFSTGRFHSDESAKPSNVFLSAHHSGFNFKLIPLY